MTDTPNLTFEQKEANKNYIFANLVKYIVDRRGNFYNFEKELGDDYWYIGSGAVNDYWNVIEAFLQEILKDRENWEIYFFYEGGDYPKGVKHRVSGKEIDTRGFGYENNYYLFGELGYRGSLWKDYDNPNNLIKKIWLEDREKRLKKKPQGKSNLSQPQPSENQQGEAENLKRQFEETRRQAEEQTKKEPKSSNLNPKKEEEKQKTNPKNDKEFNDLKNKFYETYQKGKKHAWTELVRLRTIIDVIENRTGLDNNLQDAKNELQTIWDKLTPHFATIDYCRHLIEEEGNSENKEKELDKHQLEECKKALEKLGKIAYLSPWHENFLKKINGKLKTLDLKEEIRQLKNDRTENPQQQAENQKKIAEKEKELEEIKKQTESRGNKQFQISSQVLSEFSLLSNNFNTKEKLELLINPVKDNPKFLQEIETKYQIKDLNTLFANKTFKEIIIIIKRFEYDKDKDKDKDKKIREYYGLKETDSLTNEQINGYLFLEASGRLEHKGDIIASQDRKKTNDVINVVFALVVLIVAIFGISKFRDLLKKRNLRARKNWNSYLTRKSNLVDENIRLNENVREALKWREIFDEFNWRIRLLLVKFKSKWNTAKHEQKK